MRPSIFLVMACSATCHYLNEWIFIVSWTLANKVSWNHTLTTKHCFQWNLFTAQIFLFRRHIINVNWHNHQQLADDHYVCLHWPNMQLIQCTPYFELIWVNECTLRSRVVYSPPLINNIVSFISRIMYTVCRWQLILPLPFRITLLMLVDHKIALVWSLWIHQQHRVKQCTFHWLISNDIAHKEMVLNS